MPYTTIQSITVEPLTLPLLEPFTIATGSISEARNVLITVTLRDGSIGYGECAPFPPSTGESQETALAAARGALNSCVGEMHPAGARFQSSYTAYIMRKRRSARA